MNLCVQNYSTGAIKLTLSNFAQLRISYGNFISLVSFMQINVRYFNYSDGLSVCVPIHGELICGQVDLDRRGNRKKARKNRRH